MQWTEQVHRCHCQFCRCCVPIYQMSVASTELDVTSLPELTEDDRAGDDGLDLLLGHGADGRMNGVCDGGYDDLRDLTRHRSRSPPGRRVLINPLADEDQFSMPPPSRTIASSRVALPHPMSSLFPVGAMFRSVFAQLGPASTMLTIASGARAFVDEARGHCDGYASVVARRGVQFYIGITETHSGVGNSMTSRRQGCGHLWTLSFVRLVVPLPLLWRGTPPTRPKP